MQTSADARGARPETAGEAGAAGRPVRSGSGAGETARAGWFDLALGLAFAVAVTALTWFLFGPDGRFAPFWRHAGLLAYGNAFLEGPHGPESGKIALVIAIAAPALLGAVSRSLRMVWIVPLALILADLVLRIAGWLVAGYDPGLFPPSNVMFFVVLFVVPPMVAAALGVLAGEQVERLSGGAAGRKHPGVPR